MSTEKSIKNIVWNGQQATFNAWQEKWLARANKLGYQEVVELKNYKDIPNDPNNDEGKLLLQKNNTEFADLVLSIDETSVKGRHSTL